MMRVGNLAENVPFVDKLIKPRTRKHFLVRKTFVASALLYVRD